MLKVLIWGLTFIALVKSDFPSNYERELGHHAASTGSDTRNDDQIYRLPVSVVPLEYDIYIDLYFAERNDRPFSFDGICNIVVQATEANVTQIVLHANVDTINSLSVLTASGAPVAVNVFNPFTIEPQYHFLRINLESALEIGTNYTLEISYSNTMNEGPMKRGIWRGWYTDANGNERIYATTHFQPYNARQAFPCWDEPLFKAVFKIHITRPTSYVESLSNTGVQSLSILGNGRVRDNFFPTPRMSSYLVTFLVSESFQVLAEDTTFSPPIRIIGRSNAIGLADHALNLTVRMTEFFDEYFEIPYSSLHPNLLNDHVSSPDWASAGTENWGMVSYRELYLYIDPRETIMSVEHYAATLVSHELAHKWFGNLITCYWWSNTWINEGFASFFGYIATNEKFPQYEFPEHFNSRYLQNSLSFDSSVSTVAMNHEVNTPAQVTGHFGTISYSKGAAFLRMTANIITPETFRKACKYFLINNAFEATDQYDLYNAFAEAIEEDNTIARYEGFNFTDYYRIWVNEPGYPILYVDAHHGIDLMEISQKRYFLSPTATPSDQVYPIPITYSTKSSPNFESLTPEFILSTEAVTIPKTHGNDEWVIFNNLQQGHYRVNYNERNWDLISEALLEDPESIHHMNRAQIVDDVFALMRSEALTYNFGFKILRFLRHETNYHVWDAAITGFTWLRNRLRHIPSSQAVLDLHILSQLEEVIAKVGFEASDNETPTDTMKRQAILHFACNIGYANCVQESRDRFIALRDSQTWVHPGIRRNVYISGIREGGVADFDFLENRMRTSNFANDQLEMLRALGATRDPTLLTRYLHLTLDKIVRSHDKANSFNYALLGNPENANTVLQFVKENIDAIRIAYVEDSPANPVQTALSNLASYLDEAGLVEYEEFLRSSQSDSAQYATTLSAITSARNNMAWGTANADNIVGATRDSAVTIMTSMLLLISMVVIAIKI